MNLGTQAESWAADYASRHLLWTVCAQNVHFSGGELDLVCRQGPVWVFVEVKARKSDLFGSEAELISPQKLHRLEHCIRRWLHAEGWADWRLELWEVQVRGGEATLERHFLTESCP